MEDGLEIVGREHALAGAGRLMVGAMSVVQEQVSIAHALLGFVMRQADQSPQGSNVGLRCWEIRNDLEKFGAGEDPDLLLDEADRPPGDLLEDALDALEAIPAAEFPPGLGVVVPMIVAVQLRLPYLEEAGVGDDS